MPVRQGTIRIRDAKVFVLIAVSLAGIIPRLFAKEARPTRSPQSSGAVLQASRSLPIATAAVAMFSAPCRRPHVHRSATRNTTEDDSFAECAERHAIIPTIYPPSGQRKPLRPIPRRVAFGKNRRNPAAGRNSDKPTLICLTFRVMGVVKGMTGKREMNLRFFQFRCFILLVSVCPAAVIRNEFS